MSTGRGVVFVIYNLAFAMLYFRLYPRVTQPDEPSPPPVTPPRP
jgi:hypothetical protein